MLVLSLSLSPMCILRDLDDEMVNVDTFVLLLLFFHFSPVCSSRAVHGLVI